MIWFLRITFSLVLICMLSVTTWASLQVPLWETPKSVVGYPWFTATLFDTYFAFLTFYVWVAYKETSTMARIGWLVAILLLGNLAMAVYLLIQLVRLPSTASLEALLLRRAR